MSDMAQRLTGQLEPVLASADPRPGISAYHNMPYALFRYDPEDEFELRRQVTMLQIRLEQGGKAGSPNLPGEMSRRGDGVSAAAGGLVRC